MNGSGRKETEAFALRQGTASQWQTLRRLLGLGFAYRRACALMILLQLLPVALGLASLGLTGLGIDFLRHEAQPASVPPRWPFGLKPPDDWQPMAVVAVLAAAIFSLALLNAVLKYSAAVAAASLTQRILIRLRSDVFEKLQKLSFHFYDAGESSSIIGRASGDVNAARSFVDGVIIKVIAVLLTLSVYLIYMLKVHVLLTVACLATSPLLWWGAVRFSRAVQPAYRRASELGDHLIRTLVENVQGVHVVKGFCREPQEIDKFRDANRAIRDHKFGIFWKISTFQPLMGFVTQINMLVLIGYGGYLVVRGEVALGSGMFVFANLLHEFANQIGQITNIANTIQASLTGAQRVFEVLDAPLAIDSPPDAVQLARATGGIEFRNVDFAYRSGRPVLRGVSFRAEPGECIGITGPTGAGKSTLLSLVMRFYDASAGSVLIDGIDVRKLDVDDLRRNVGLVFQENFLFSNTIEANIAFGDPDAPLEEIERAAQTAAADEFITDSPQGYQTIIGEYGANLSGGQRQRLAIARAVLLDPPILLLDDATASVDPETEHEIREALESAVVGRTTLVVSNRLSSLSWADRILVLQNGQVSSEGTHDELLRSCPYYQGLAALQFADAVEEVVEGVPAASAKKVS